MDAAGRPMHHVLQIDCAEVPQIDPDFPAEGMLWLFITGNYDQRGAPSLGEDDGASKIIYARKPGSKPVEHPAETPPLGEYSYAQQSVKLKIEPKPEPKGILARLLGKQPKAYSGTAQPGYFAPVPLTFACIDSHPDADPKPLYDALNVVPSETTAEDGIRPLQMLGYAPSKRDLERLKLHRFRKNSPALARKAYDFAQARGGEDDVLLFQLAHGAGCNLDLISDSHVTQFVVSRQDLRARDFDKHQARFDKVNHAGRWFAKPPKPELADLMANVTQRAGLILKPLVPGEPTTANQFCGWPQLPTSLEWPCNSEGQPLHFLMQLDCATLPALVDGLALPELPSEGTFFLFVDALTNGLYEGAVRLIYTPDTVSHLPFVEPPATLAPLRDEGFHRTSLGIFRRDYGRKPPETDVPIQAPNWEPRLPFEMVPYVGVESAEYSEELEVLERAALERALPEDPLAENMVSAIIDFLPNWTAALSKKIAEDMYKLENGVQLVPPSFPWRWSDIQECMVSYFEQYRFLICPEDIDERDEQAARAREALWGSELDSDVRAWAARVMQENPLGRIPQDVAEEYRAWLVRLDTAGATLPIETDQETRAERDWRFDLHNAFFTTLEPLATPPLRATRHFTLHDDNADDIPADIRSLAANQLRYDRSSTEFRSERRKPSPHVLFGPKDPGDVESEDILLLTIATDYGLTTLWGQGSALQIWISPEDLAGCRFDRVRAQIGW